MITAGLPVTGLAFKVPEPYAVKVARTVLRGRKLPGWATLEKKKMKKKTIVTLLIASPIIGFIAFIGILFFGPNISDFIDRTEFNSYKWKNWEQTTEEPSLRWHMIHDLESKYEFKGMTINKLKELLGEPENKSETEVSYFLGMYQHSIDTATLVFELKSGKVIHFYVRHG